MVEGEVGHLPLHLDPLRPRRQRLVLDGFLHSFEPRAHRLQVALRVGEPLRERLHLRLERKALLAQVLLLPVDQVGAAAVHRCEGCGGGAGKGGAASAIAVGVGGGRGGEL